MRLNWTVKQVTKLFTFNIITLLDAFLNFYYLKQLHMQLTLNPTDYSFLYWNQVMEGNI